MSTVRRPWGIGGRGGRGQRRPVEVEQRTGDIDGFHPSRQYRERLGRVIRVIDVGTAATWL